ncbi:MAG: hypothetical protein OSB57_15500 [Planctomycetota bacterium]|nr:hypothetical protein [Planctomycetota bacterium]
MFLVLTLDWFGTLDGGGHMDRGVEAAYKLWGRNWMKAKRAISYQLEKRGLEPLGSEWVQVIEQHKNGRPHANVLIHHPQLAAIVREQLAENERNPGSHRRDAMGGWLLEVFVKFGFGRISSADIARDKGELANYLAKTAGTVKEVGKLCQLPMAAPKGFRRVRSGKGFLPALLKKLEQTKTGCNIDADGRVVGTSSSTVPAVLRDQYPHHQLRAVGANVINLTRSEVYIGRAVEPDKKGSRSVGRGHHVHEAVFLNPFG